MAKADIAEAFTHFRVLPHPPQGGGLVEMRVEVGNVRPNVIVKNGVGLVRSHSQHR